MNLKDLEVCDANVARNRERERGGVEEEWVVSRRD